MAVPPRYHEIQHSVRSYTVGWFSPLPCERAAAEALRDEIHGPPTDFQRASDDHLEYSWGKIGDHNFVLASLEAGTDGLGAAAHTATRMLASFPGIRFSLLVGIGGAIPRFDREGGVYKLRRNPDVRLGDVVVSQPNGNGGVIQYDHYKATKDGLQVKGSLNRPPPALLYGLAALQAKHLQSPSNVPSIIIDLEEKNDYMVNERGYKHPGQKKDRLFYPSYAHPAGDPDCEDCLAQHEVERRPRKNSNPQVHYGTIASGNVVVKNAEDRENLIRHHPSASECLCYEMEAAGLMNNFPCLVIRGICDYSDSHKNDVWHNYAALVAAAFAKELLLNMARDTVEEAAMAKDWMKDRVDMIAYHTMKNEIESTLKTTKTYSKSAEIQSTLQSVNLDIKEAGQWFLDSSEFQRWMNSCGSLLWVYGLAGSGKTVLSASVINYLQSNLAQENVSKVVLHYYFDFQELKKGENLRPLGCMLRSFLIQLSRTHDYMLENLYKRLQTFRGELCESKLGEMLFQMTALHSDVKIVIDALDEMEYRQRETVCGWITETLELHPDRFSFFVTSRRERDIEEQFHRKCESLEMSADCDIEKYVLARIKEYQLNKGQRWSEESLRKIQDVLLRQADGMFQWVVCQLDQLLDHPQTVSFGDDEIDGVLKELPQDLTNTYDQILKHIPYGKKDDACRLLQLLLFCKRPIRVLEASEFLSVKCSGFSVSKRIKYPREVTCYCPSLVTLRESYSEDGFTLYKSESESESEYGFRRRGPHSGDSAHRSTEIVLAHSSVRDYFLSKYRTPVMGQVDLFGQLEANKAIFKTCLHYVHFLSMSDADPYSQDLHDKFPLASYAGHYLLAHASAARTDEDTVNAATALCRNENTFRTWVCHRSFRTAWHFGQKALSHVLMEKVMKASAQYAAARYGLNDYLQDSLERESYSVCRIKSVYPPFGFWMTGDRRDGNKFLRIYQSLILDNLFKTHRSLILDKLLDKTYQSISPLYIAAESGHEDVVRMLIKAGFIIDEVGGPRGTALDVACAHGCVGVVEALLEDAKKRSISTIWLEKPLRQVFRTGSSQLIRVFLHHGFLTYSTQPSIESAIFDAALYGNAAVVQELLPRCCRLRNLANLSLPWSSTNTPSFLGRLSAWIPGVFSWFGGSSHEHTAAQSLKSYDGALDRMLEYVRLMGIWHTPVDRAHLFSTALQAAAFEGHDEIAEALLEEGRDPNATGGFFGTVLQAAAAGGSPKIVQRLLDAGADPNTTGGFFKTALNASLMTVSQPKEVRYRNLNTGRYTDRYTDHSRARFKYRLRDRTNNETVVAALLKAGARPYRGVQELRSALALGSQEAALNIIKNAVSGAGQVAGDFHTVATLLRGENVADSVPLHDAISRGFSRVVESMICNGAAIDVLDSFGRTPLHNAMRQNNQDVAFIVIQAVTEQPNDVSLLKAKDSNGMTAVHYAAQKPVSSETMKQLLRVAKQAGVLIEYLDARTNHGRTALHYACNSISDETSSKVELLIDAAAGAGILAGYINVRDDRGDTALHRAASSHEVRSVTLLLQAGANEEAMNLNKQSFVDCAREGGRAEHPWHFFDVCPVPVGPFYSSMEEARAIASAVLLHQFVELNDVAAVTKVVEEATFHRSFLDIPDADCGMTPLHHAAEKGYTAVGELLLDLGAQPEGVDKKKMTPLHRAAKSGCLKMVTAILQRMRNKEKEDCIFFPVADFREDDFNGFLTGMPSDHQDLWGNTPLHYAVQNESIEMVKSLVHCGATMHRRNKEGYTPFDLARKKREAFYVAEIQMPRDIVAVSSIAIFLEEEDKKYDGDS